MYALELQRSALFQERTIQARPCLFLAITRLFKGQAIPSQMKWIAWHISLCYQLACVHLPLPSLQLASPELGPHPQPA